MICDQTKIYKGELSMAQKQINTNLTNLLFVNADFVLTQNADEN
jgi:hypothetical protein